MPYALRKAPNRDLYWVVNRDTGKKYSNDPIVKEKAEAQLRILKGGGPMPTANILHLAAEGAYGNNPPPLFGLKLVESTPTLKFYVGGNTVVVAIRGTYDMGDVGADAMVAFGQLARSKRYIEDKKTLEQFQLRYPRDQYDYYGTGHSLGGAILDLFLAEGLLDEGRSYNPAIQPQTIFFDNKKNHRVYNKADALYKLMGRWTNTEVRENRQEPVPLPNLGIISGAVAEGMNFLNAHGLNNFIGGGRGAFEKQLRESGLSPQKYLRLAQEKAKKEGYPHKLLGFANDGDHKLAIPNQSGKMIKFGKVGYGDFLLWSHEEAAGEVPEGTAAQKRRVFHKSHEALKGDWRKDAFSPNSLALRILW